MTFDGVLGQDALVGTLAKRIVSGGEDIGRHLVLAGPDGSGKMTIAEIYVQAILCEKRAKGASAPCHDCDECKGVREKSSWNYLPLDARALGDEQNIRDFAGTIGGLRTAEWRILLVDNAELLDPSAADVMLKTLEKFTKTIFIFLVNDISKFSAAIRSRGQSFRMQRPEPQVLVAVLADICQREVIRYERAALNAIVKTSRAYVGAAFRQLVEISGRGDVTLASTLKILGLDWGKTMLRCWHAQLSGRANEALSHFDQIADCDEARVRAMQVFLLAFHLRLSTAAMRRVDVSLTPALDEVSDESWQSIILGWQALAQRRSIAVENVVADVMKFWRNVRVGSPSRSSFIKGYEVLMGSPGHFAGSRGERKRGGIGVAS